VDASFDAAYLLASQQIGRELVTGRVDWFDVRDNSFRILDNNDERGWAVTAAWRHPLSKHAALFFEALHVRSDRPARAYLGQQPEQVQTTLQSALRLTF
jgi:hypothetical protein